jgi:hypothetical protein
VKEAQEYEVFAQPHDHKRRVQKSSLKGSCPPPPTKGHHILLLKQWRLVFFMLFLFSKKRKKLDFFWIKRVFLVYIPLFFYFF